LFVAFLCKHVNDDELIFPFITVLNSSINFIASSYLLSISNTSLGISIPSKILNQIDEIIDKHNLSREENIISSASYSFGFAPTITGFVFLTNYGRLFKLENQNPEVLGKNITFITTIDSRKDFINISRIVYAEDIKQYFSAITKSGIVYTSENLKDWDRSSVIKLK